MASMPNRYVQAYFPVFVQILLAMSVAGAMLAGSYLVGKKVRNPVKDLPYECGIVPVGSARERFSVKFYLVAMVFILFDIEAMFLFPWAVIFRELGFLGLTEMLIFIGMALCGFFYVWKSGALDWSKGGPSDGERE